MGVALSILGNNTSSLVGVAISASLLPPAVNCGMLLTFAALARWGRGRWAKSPCGLGCAAQSVTGSLLLFCWA